MTEEDYTVETISGANVKKLALDKDFGKLDFEDSLDNIAKLQKYKNNVKGVVFFKV